MRRVKATNGWKLVLIVTVAAMFIAVGARHVWTSRKPLLMRQQIFNELSRSRELRQAGDVLGRQIYEMRAAPRVNRWASDLLGMRPPRPDEVIHIRDSEGGR